MCLIKHKLLKWNRQVIQFFNLIDLNKNRSFQRIKWKVTYSNWFYHTFVCIMRHKSSTFTSHRTSLDVTMLYMTWYPFSFSKAPIHNSNNSSTWGRRKLLIVILGSFGPGMIPKVMTFSHLKRWLLGRFIKTRKIIPKEYYILLKGSNQSTFNMTSRFLGSLKYEQL